MAGLNARVKIDGESETVVAADFVSQSLGVVAETHEQRLIERLWRTTSII